MAHVLTAYDGTEGTTLDFMSAVNGAAGYALQMFEQQPREIETFRASSLYHDGSRPLFSRAGNVLETIVIDVVGSSKDDLAARVRALLRLGENARAAARAPGVRAPAYLTWQPDGMTTAVYSVIWDVSVRLPETYLGEQYASRTIEGVVLTVEREPHWRGCPPVSSTTLTDWSIQTARYAISRHWGKLDIDGLSVPAVLGDIPSLTRIDLLGYAGGPMQRAVIGYRSYAQGGSWYNLAGLIEAETFALEPWFASYAIDATASPGIGNTKVRTSFAFDATMKRRLYGNVLLSAGVYRVYARAKVTTANTTANVYLKWSMQNNGDPNMPYFSNTTENISSTNWRMVDLGIVEAWSAAPTLLAQATMTGGLDYGVAVHVYAGRSAGVGELDIDFLFFMPVDEGLIVGLNLNSDSDANNRLIYDDITPYGPVAYVGYGDRPVGSGVVSGSVNLKPGKGCLYFIIGNSAWENSWNTPPTVLWVHHCPLYLNARGAS